MNLSAPYRLIVLMCCAELLATIPAGTYAPLIPALRSSWHMSNAQAGLVDGSFQTGYLLASPVLLALSDRVDPKRIFVFSAILSSVASILLALVATGWVSAMPFRLASGIGLAGTYLPGLRVLSDRLSPTLRQRAVAYYTATFSAGASVAVLTAGLAGHGFGWRGAFAVAAIGALIAASICATVIAAPAVGKVPSWRETLNLKPAFSNTSSLAFNLAYAAHMWELYGFRAWIVTFLVFVATLSGTSAVQVPLLASFVLLVGLPASIIGNELSARFGRVRVICMVMLMSASVALSVPTLSLSLLSAFLICSAYSFLVSADSGALTAGAVHFAAPGRQGATLAVHSVLGFLAAGISPSVVGLVLDHGSGVGAWTRAFGVLAGGVLLGPVVLRALRPQ